MFIPHETHRPGIEGRVTVTEEKLELEESFLLASSQAIFHLAPKTAISENIVKYSS